MQGVDCWPMSDGELTGTKGPLTIDVEETTETRIQRLISENPVIIFSRSSCCLCHSMKRLLSAIGVHPTVIELEDSEIREMRPVLAAHDSNLDAGAPTVFIGGSYIGSIESLVALHLSGALVPKLREVVPCGDD